MRTQTLSKLVILLGALLAWSGVASAQQWVPAPTPTADQGGAFKPGSTALQLTDGTIMVQEFTSSTWWKLTPDEHAHYNTGTWSKLASSVAYSPLDQITIVPYAARLFSSAVLPDGRVIIEGGEYTYNPDGTSQGATRTNMGAIYNPVTNVWTPVHPPPAPVTSANPLGVWPKIGDAPGIVLPNFTDGALSPGGTFMLGNIQSKQAALLDTTTTPLSWTVIPSTGKSDRNSEEGWTLLPNGDVLTVDTGNPVAGLPNNSEVFNPGAGTWTSAGNTKVPLSYLTCATTQVHEIGPAVLRPDGTVFATGVNTCGGAGNTAIYFANSGGADPWKATPKIPCDVDGSTKVCNDMADAPASILPDGNVLVQTSPGSNTGNSTFYEFDFSTNTFSPEIPPPTTGPGFTQGNSESGRMLAVASGNVFYMRAGEPGGMWFYVPQGTYNPVWAPLVINVTDNGICVGCLNIGGTYTISGTQLNGLSGGAAYGDDAQSASNYPLVLIENCASGHKFFARTHDFPTGVATGLFTVVTTQFDVTPNIETGPSNLIVIANGIPSLPFGGSGQACGSFIDVLPPQAGN